MQLDLSLNRGLISDSDVELGNLQDYKQGASFRVTYVVFTAWGHCSCLAGFLVPYINMFNAPCFFKYWGIKIMSKVDGFLDECKKNLGNWTCSLHTTGSNQPAAIFREAKKLGYEFEEVSSGRWAKSMFCPVCGCETTHYKLVKAIPVFNRQVRLSIDKKTRDRILKIFGNKDAFTGGTISSVAEIDHKVPWTRLEEDIDAKELTEEEVRIHFQLLTREHNLLKDRACSACKKENIRPAFLGIPFWYSGGAQYQNTCEGCGWFDGEKWRNELSKKILKG